MGEMISKRCGSCHLKHRTYVYSLQNHFASSDRAYTLPNRYNIVNAAWCNTVIPCGRCKCCRRCAGTRQMPPSCAIWNRRCRRARANSCNSARNTCEWRTMLKGTLCNRNHERKFSLSKVQYPCEWRAECTSLTEYIRSVSSVCSQVYISGMQKNACQTVGL